MYIHIHVISDTTFSFCFSAGVLVTAGVRAFECVCVRRRRWRRRRRRRGVCACVVGGGGRWRRWWWYKDAGRRRIQRNGRIGQYVCGWRPLGLQLWGADMGPHPTPCAPWRCRWLHDPSARRQLRGGGCSRGAAPARWRQPLRSVLFSAGHLVHHRGTSQQWGSPSYTSCRLRARGLQCEDGAPR